MLERARGHVAPRSALFAASRELHQSCSARHPGRGRPGTASALDRAAREDAVLINEGARGRRGRGFRNLVLRLREPRNCGRRGDKPRRAEWRDARSLNGQPAFGFTRRIRPSAAMTELGRRKMVRFTGFSSCGYSALAEPRPRKSSLVSA